MFKTICHTEPLETIRLLFTQNQQKPHNEILKNLIDEILKSSSIKTLHKITNEKEFLDFFKNNLIYGFLHDVRINSSIEELKKHIQIIFKVFDGNINFKTEGYTKTSLSTSVSAGNFLSVISEFFFNYIQKTIEIWKRSFEIVEEFSNLYFGIYQIEAQIQIEMINIAILENLVKRMELLFESNKIDYLSLSEEQNNLFFHKIQLSKLKNELQSRQKQAVINKFDISNVVLFEICDNKFLKTYSKKFVNYLKLEFLLEKDGDFLCSPVDISEYFHHFKEKTIPVDFNFNVNSYTKGGDSQLSLGVNLSFAKCLQWIYSNVTDNMHNILQAIYTQGKNNQKISYQMVDDLIENMNNIDGIKKEYIVLLEKELIKLQVNPGNIINTLKYIENNLLNILNHHHKINADLHISKFKNQKILISIYLTFYVMSYYNLIIEDIDKAKAKKNPFNETK